jgi:hypothetical protein
MLRAVRALSFSILLAIPTAAISAQTASGADSTRVLPSADSAQSVLPPIASAPWDSTGWTGRLVVGEYLTGIYCGFCQPHDAAFNALLERYPRTAFVSLAYHYAPNLPLGDPADSNYARLHRWYGVDRGAPKVFDQMPATGDDDWIDGRSVNSTIDLAGLLSGIFGGSSPSTPSTPSTTPATSASLGNPYPKLVRAVDAELRRAPEAFVRMQARMADGQVRVQVHVDSVTGNHPQTLLRLLLVEDTVALQHPLYWYRQRAEKLGVNERPLRREHHMVVRAVARQLPVAMGIPMSGSGTLPYTFDLAAIQHRRAAYHTEGFPAVARAHPAYLTDTADVTMIKGILSTFPDAQDWTINPARLHVIAFVQDAHTGEVLQAAMVHPTQ